MLYPTEIVMEKTHEIPQYLYKILSLQNWQATQNENTVQLSSADDTFIHFSTEDQLDRIIEKYWANEPAFIILKIDSSKLEGSLEFETNPGGSTPYYHLYNGFIPYSSILESTIKENVMDTHTIVKRPALLIIGIDCRTSNNPEAAPQDIPKLWDKFYREDVTNRIPNKLSNEVIALYCDYEGDYTKPYSVVIGCPVSSLDTIPEGMVAKTIPASSYALFRAIGEHPKSLIETWGHIWQQSNLERTYIGDFELYGNKFASGSPREVEVYIGIH